MSDLREDYLGDGLYAAYDGYQVRLRAPRDGRDDLVFMEPRVLQAFYAFADRAMGTERRDLLDLVYAHYVDSEGESLPPELAARVRAATRRST